MEQKQQLEYKLLKLIDGTELVGQVSVSNNDKFLRIEEPLQLKTVAKSTQFGARDDSSLAPWIPFSNDKVFSIPKERVITIASINKDLTHYYEVILKRLKTQPVKPPLTPQEMDKIMKLAEEMEKLEGKKIIFTNINLLLLGPYTRFYSICKTLHSYYITIGFFVKQIAYFTLTFPKKFSIII